MLVTKPAPAEAGGGSPIMAQLSMMANPGGNAPARIIRPVDQILELVAQTNPAEPLK